MHFKWTICANIHSGQLLKDNSGVNLGRQNALRARVAVAYHVDAGLLYLDAVKSEVT